MKRRILFKVEQNRVLVPVGEPCPFGCRYCYTRGGEVGLARVEAEDILSRLEEFALYTPFETFSLATTAIRLPAPNEVWQCSTAWQHWAST
jgi:hypothetical protein